MAKQFIKNGIVRTAQTAKREGKLKLQGYVEFKPKSKAKPKPKTETE